MMKHLFTEKVVPIESDNKAIKIDYEKCIKCGLCKRVCEREIGVANFFDLEKKEKFVFLFVRNEL